MSLFSLLYNLIIGPPELLFDVVYAFMIRMTQNPGVSIIALSLAINFLILPLYMRADAMQEEEKIRAEKLSRGVTHIKKTFKGDERFMMLQTYYRQNHYKPYYALKGSLSLLLEIPFFIAAYNFLSGLALIKGTSFGPIRDLGLPDGLLPVAGHQINLLPILMTAINIVSGVIYTKGMPLKSKIQLYGMAMIFLVLLYNSPSGLVFYWTLNNLFSLIKNIFYKLKNPKFVLCVISAAAGLPAFVYLLFHPMGTPRMRIFTLTASLLLVMPLAVSLLIKKFRLSLKGLEAAVSSDPDKAGRTVFYISAAILTVVTGLLIPSAVISSSPEEFVGITDFHSPLRYVLQSLLLAAGTFLIWFNVFYYLASSGVKRIISITAAVIACSSVVNYMFFGRNYGNMSPMLQYDTFEQAGKSEYFLNLAVLIGLGVLLVFIWKKKQVVLKTVGLAVCLTVLAMSLINIVSIHSVFSGMNSSDSNRSGNGNISFPLDKEGKNVVVIMLDRAISDFFPYIINEKPVLEKQFAGFTYYPNTISYGNTTLAASSALYGGYEYTPEAWKSRDVTIRQRQNEALKIMPYTFDENGYDVTVCDPSMAGLRWMPDLTIYSDHPDIRAFITKNRFMDRYSPEDSFRILSRNFFAYSLFRSSPVLLHATFYNSGQYNQSSGLSSVQVTLDMYRASGGFDGASPIFTGSYSVLKNLPLITEFRSEGRSTFLMMSNDTTHDIAMLQEPDYLPADTIDNSPFEENPPVRYAADGSSIVFSTPLQIKHYQSNMAAMLRLGEWLDYLREKGVYDNTRIIIVADHGKGLDYLTDQRFDEEGTGYSDGTDDVMTYSPLLLVKDFGSSELTTDASFMTNADTPSLAFSGLIDNPVNPFTGNPITDEGKNVPEILIALPAVYTPNDYSGNETEYRDVTWVGFRGTDTDDLSAWRVIGNNIP